MRRTILGFVLTVGIAGFLLAPEVASGGSNTARMTAGPVKTASLVIGEGGYAVLGLAGRTELSMRVCRYASWPKAPCILVAEGGDVFVCRGGSCQWIGTAGVHDGSDPVSGKCFQLVMDGVARWVCLMTIVDDVDPISAAVKEDITEDPSPIGTATPHQWVWVGPYEEPERGCQPGNVRVRLEGLPEGQILCLVPMSEIERRRGTPEGAVDGDDNYVQPQRPQAAAEGDGNERYDWVDGRWVNHANVERAALVAQRQFLVDPDSGEVLAEIDPVTGERQPVAARAARAGEEALAAARARLFGESPCVDPRSIEEIDLRTARPPVDLTEHVEPIGEPVTQSVVQTVRSRPGEGDELVEELEAWIATDPVGSACYDDITSCQAQVRDACGTHGGVTSKPRRGARLSMCSGTGGVVKQCCTGDCADGTVVTCAQQRATSE